MVRAYFQMWMCTLGTSQLCLYYRFYSLSEFRGEPMNAVQLNRAICEVAISLGQLQHSLNVAFEKYLGVLILNSATTLLNTWWTSSCRFAFFHLSSSEGIFCGDSHEVASALSVTDLQNLQPTMS